MNTDIQNHIVYNIEIGDRANNSHDSCVTVKHEYATLSLGRKALQRPSSCITHNYRPTATDYIILTLIIIKMVIISVTAFSRYFNNDIVIRGSRVEHINLQSTSESQ